MTGKDILNFSVKNVEGIKVVELIGNLTSGTINSYLSVLKAITDKESAIVDLSELSLITSSGMTALLESSEYAKNSGRRVILFGASRELLRMTENLDMYGCLIFSQSIDEARTKIKFFT